jgi:hypothetical protein
MQERVMHEEDCHEKVRAEKVSGQKRCQEPFLKAEKGEDGDGA